MRPIKFKESDRVFAEDQEEYIDLPAWMGPNGEVITCWKLSFMERLTVLFMGVVWVRKLTFRKPLQPMFLQTENPWNDLEQP